MTDTFDEVAFQVEHSALQDIGEKNGIKHTIWSCDIKASQMNDPHTLGEAKWVKHRSAGCYADCCSNGRVKLHGTRWIDVWIAFDRLREKEAMKQGGHLTCDHIFVERVERRGDVLLVSTGS